MQQTLICVWTMVCVCGCYHWPISITLQQHDIEGIPTVISTVRSDYLHLCYQHMHMYTSVYIGMYSIPPSVWWKVTMLGHPKVLINKNSMYVYIVLCTNVCV